LLPQFTLFSKILGVQSKTFYFKETKIMKIIFEGYRVFLRKLNIKASFYSCEFNFIEFILNLY
jgi:hypothetical protein